MNTNHLFLTRSGQVMRRISRQPLVLLSILCVTLFSISSASAQGDTPQSQPLEQNPIAAISASLSTFNYQGQLNDGGNPANGTYDFQFTLWDGPTAGTQVGSPMTKEDVAIANGAFAVDLDFGANAFQGDARYLEVGVRPGNSSGEFTMLNPRQAVSAVPYAIHADHTLYSTQLRAVNGSPVDTVAVNKGLYFYQSTNAADGLPFARLEEMWGMRFNSPDPRFVLSSASAMLVGYAPDSRQWGAGDLLVSGNVGIGTAEPQNKLDVNGVNIRLKNGDKQVYLSSGGEAIDLVSDTNSLFIQSTATGSCPWNCPNVLINPWNENAKVGIGTADPQAKLDVAGRTRTQVLEITGGSDLAEPFEIISNNAVQPGMVVAIDPDHPGQLRIADQAYDRTVAGVVSGAGGISPGLLLQQQGTIAAGSHPVALTGRVYVWADSAYGAIEPGDLLTTSATPGHAMKAIDHERAGGTILGKAMTKLEAGKGLVLVLITLQ